MKTPERYALRCMAPDGATVREGLFPDVEAAWERASDMGSRWYFYPIRLVTGPSRSDLARIVSVPHGVSDFWRGRTVRSFAQTVALNPDAVSAWLEGRAPLDL